MRTILNYLEDKLRFVTFVLCALLCAATISCGGDDEEDNSGNKQENNDNKQEITTTNKLLTSAGDDVSLNYTSTGTIKVAFDNETTYLYSYNPEKITTSDGSFSITDIKRNSSGAITSMKMTSSKGSTRQATITYDSDGHITKYVLDNYTETTFTWQDGKLVKFEAKGTYSTRTEVDKVVFEYENNKYKNTTGQYTFSMFECEIDGVDWLYLTGSFGRAGNYLPTKVTCTEDVIYSDGQTKTESKEYTYSYTLNSDGTVATETGNGTTRKYTYVTLE